MSFERVVMGTETVTCVATRTLKRYTHTHLYFYLCEDFHKHNHPAPYLLLAIPTDPLQLEPAKMSSLAKSAMKEAEIVNLQWN